MWPTLISLLRSLADPKLLGLKPGCFCICDWGLWFQAIVFQLWCCFAVLFEYEHLGWELCGLFCVILIPFGIKLSFFHEKKRFHFVTTFAGIYYFICPFSHWVDGYRNGCWFLVVLRFWNFCEKKLKV